MAKLSSRGRKNVKRDNYAVPKGTGSDPSRDQYPIHDRSHAQNALSQVAKHGSSSEKHQVRRKVADKYPGIDQSGDAQTGQKRKRRK